MNREEGMVSLSGRTDSDRYRPACRVNFRGKLEELFAPNMVLLLCNIT